VGVTVQSYLKWIKDSGGVIVRFIQNLRGKILAQTREKRGDGIDPHRIKSADEDQYFCTITKHPNAIPTIQFAACLDQFWWSLSSLPQISSSLFVVIQRSNCLSQSRNT